MYGCICGIANLVISDTRSEEKREIFFILVVNMKILFLKITRIFKNTL